MQCALSSLFSYVLILLFSVHSRCILTGPFDKYFRIFILFFNDFCVSNIENIYFRKLIRNSYDFLYSLIHYFLKQRRLS